MKKIMLLLVMGLFLMSLASADINLNPGKQAECIELQQTCDTCTWVNISSITRTGENSTRWNLNAAMTKFGVDYSYTFCDTYVLGEYVYSVYGNKGGGSDIKSENGYFTITPSGKGGTENMIFYIIILTVIFGLALIGFFGQNEIITLFGSLLMLIFGIYLVTGGLIIYRDWLTNALSYICIGLGAYLSIVAAMSLIEDL